MKKGNKRIGKSCEYIKEECQDEIRTRNGYIRRLQENQHASEEAINNALALGDLPERMTCTVT